MTWDAARARIVRLVEETRPTYRDASYAAASFRHAPEASAGAAQLDARRFWLTTLAARTRGHTSAKATITRADVVLSIAYPDATDASRRDVAIVSDYDAIRSKLLDEAGWSGSTIRAITAGEDDVLPMTITDLGAHVVAEIAFTVEYHQ